MNSELANITLIFVIHFMYGPYFDQNHRKRLGN